MKRRFGREQCVSTPTEPFAQGNKDHKLMHNNAFLGFIDALFLFLILEKKRGLVEDVFHTAVLYVCLPAFFTTCAHGLALDSWMHALLLSW